MEESQKQIADDDKSLTQTQQNQKVVPADFELYLLNALNESLIKKSK